MTENNAANRLMLDYEAARRQEQTMMHRMLDVLPKVENFDPQRVEQVRDALFHADHPYLMVFVGPFSSGKSSLINALLGDEKLLRVGPTPTTDRVTILRHGDADEGMTSGGDVDTHFHPSPLLQKVSIVDTPGLESVFKTHESATQRFLHRSDTVFMVMLATQAMSASNLEALKTLKEYGKNIILLINQADLLSDTERETVREYVQDQSQAKLGYKPQVWMVSALRGLQANKATGGRDAALWSESGLDKVERYIQEQLTDAARMRQKLQTPLQIAQNVNRAALDVVRNNQQTFDRYAVIAENVRTQLETQRRAQQKNIREMKEEISTRFGEAAQRGSEAIHTLFSFSQGLGLVLRGFLELVRLGGVLRLGGKTATLTAFNRRKAFEPLDMLSRHVDELSARLEGRDLQDIDNLVSYSQQQVSALPAPMQSKLIGKIQAPQNYNRSHLLDVRDSLETIEQEARTVELETLSDVLKNTMIYLAVFELILFIFVVVITSILVSDPTGAFALVLLLTLGMMLLGLAFVPLRGRMLENAYTQRMFKLQQRYLETLDTAAEHQLTHAMKLREDACSPLLRLIEAQTETQAEQLKALQGIQQEMAQIEATLADLGKRKWLG